MFVKFFELVASRSKIFAGIELFGLLNKHSTDGGGHGQTSVGVDIDLADGRFGGSSELIFGNADRIFQLATILVDFGYYILWNTGRTVKNNGKPGIRFSISARMSSLI